MCDEITSVIVSSDVERDFAQIISDTIRRNHNSILDGLRQWTSLQYFEQFILDLCITSRVGSGYVVCSSDGTSPFDKFQTKSPTLSPSAMPTTGVAVNKLQSDVIMLGASVPIWLIVLFVLLILLCLCCLYLCCYVAYRKTRKDTQTINNTIKITDEKTLASDESNKSDESSDSEDQSDIKLLQKDQVMLALPPSHQRRYLLQAGYPPLQALPQSRSIVDIAVKKT